MKTINFIVNLTILFLFVQTYGASSSNSMITASSNVTCIQGERQSLLVFRQGLSDRSNRLSTWTGVECCEWRGVGCDRRTGHVIKLDLRSSSLSTFSWVEVNVSPSLLNLTHLRYLDLSMNYFLGQNIPEFFGSFKYLEYLNLSYSGFSGEVPPHLGNLSRLQNLDLSYSRFSGEVPPHLGNLSRLQNLDLNNNNDLMLKNDMRWVSLLSSLKHLDLSWITIGNHIDWLHPVSMLPSLLTLNLAWCDINSIPSTKSINFTSLNSLDLSFNGINTIPYWLSNLTGLEYLDLGNNSFHGGIPDSIGNLSSLKVLSLSENQLSGPIPPSIGGLSSLTILNLRNNQLSGNIPTSLGQLSNLEILHLDGNQLSGVVSEDHFTKLYHLTLLWLSHNSLITFNVSRHWIPPFQLKYFYASSCCNMGPQFPNWLQTQTHLEILYLRNSRIRDTIPEWFHNISSHLEWLDLSDNNIGPEFPNIQTSTDLRYLKLRNSSIRESIPEWFQNISSHLWFLDLSDNQIHGNLSRININNTGMQDNNFLSLQFCLGGNRIFLDKNFFTAVWVCYDLRL